MRKLRSLRAASLLLAASFPFGCVALSYGTFSTATLPAGDAEIVSRESLHWYGRSRGDTIALPDSTLSVLPHNERVSFVAWGILVPVLPSFGGTNRSESYTRFRTHEMPAFLFTLTITPRAGVLRFDPRGASLHLPTGATLQPIGYWGPITGLDWGYQPNLNGCRAYEQATRSGDPIAAIPAAEIREPIEVAEETCFTLLFAVSPPPPDQEFSLEISGLAREDQPLGVPAIRHVPDSGWEFKMVDVQ